MAGAMERSSLRSSRRRAALAGHRVDTDKSAPSQVPVARSADESFLGFAFFLSSGAEGDRTPDLMSAIQEDQFL